MFVHARVEVKLPRSYHAPRIACGRSQLDRVEVLTGEGFLPVHLDHLAVAARDKQRSATFLKDLPGAAFTSTTRPDTTSS
jgi:hypothetical protein